MPHEHNDTVIFRYPTCVDPTAVWPIQASTNRHHDRQLAGALGRTVGGRTAPSPKAAHAVTQIANCTAPSAGATRPHGEITVTAASDRGVPALRARKLRNNSPQCNEKSKTVLL